MARFTLVIGNKNYSSWSLRAWLALWQTGAAFDEVVIPLDRDDTAEAIRQWSSAGKVPILRDGDLTVWDSLAIGEYLAEQFPDAGLWPREREARAVARCAAAEMHSGFAALRRDMPMDVRRRTVQAPSADVAADIARICALWAECRARFGEGRGDFLFGDFTLADAFYAPVASRFVTYGVELPDTAQSYVDTVMATPALRAWADAAGQEPWVIADP
jgi:glutathione S-transferase